MEEYYYYVFQSIFMVVVAVIVLSTCLLGCYKSMKNIRSCETADETITINVHQTDEPSDEREASAHDFNRGHERALPEIPSTLTRVATSVEDEEEEDDSIYDIISRSKKIQIPVDNHVDLPDLHSSVQTKMQRQHPYEKVGGDTDGDSSNYGPPSRDPLYAGIKDVSEKSDNSQQTNIPASATSVSAADTFYMSADNVLTLNTSQCSESYPQNHSPPPPWRFQDCSLSPEQSNNVPDEGSDIPLGQDVQQDVLSSLWSQNQLSDSRDTQMETGQPNGATDLVPMSSGDHIVPNYSSVTARESLNNLRKRGQMLCDNQEEMYDTINYDAIKSGSRIQRTSVVLSSDHVYCTTGSDLYAEITTGQSSSQSSMYARVSDVLPQSISNFSLPNRSGSPMQLSHESPRSSLTDDPPAPFVIRSHYNPEFPIYSMVNKVGRQKVFQTDEDKSHTSKSLQKFCKESTLPFQKSCSPLNELGSTSSANQAVREAAESLNFDEKMKTKCRSEHSYSKIVFNKRYSNLSFSKPTISLNKEKPELSVYDHIGEEPFYESVPVSCESKTMRFPSHIRLKSHDKIKLPWKEKQRKSNDEFKLDISDAKKSKLINGYCCESAMISIGLLSNNGLNKDESKFDMFSSRNCITNGCKHLTSSGIVKTTSEDCSTLGKSKFYVSSNILLGNSNASPCSSMSQIKGTPIREHIYELVKDAIYIDDEDDVVLESDV